MKTRTFGFLALAVLAFSVASYSQAASGLVFHWLVAALGAPVDFTAAGSTIPQQKAASAPTTCVPGQRYFDTTQNLAFVCTAANVWSVEITASNLPAGSTAAKSFTYSVTAIPFSAVITHNLNTFSVEVQCFDGATPANWVLPASVQLTSLNTVTVFFSSAASGNCVVRD